MKSFTVLAEGMIDTEEKQKLVEMEDSLEAMQKMVGGMIEEYMPFEDDVALVCNDEANVNLKVIQDTLGHTDISTTMNIYAGHTYHRWL